MKTRENIPDWVECLPHKETTFVLAEENNQKVKITNLKFLTLFKTNDFKAFQISNDGKISGNEI